MISRKAASRAACAWAAAMLAAIPAHGVGWVSSLQSDRDSEDLLATWSAQAGVKGWEPGAGSIDLLGEFRRNEVEENRFGLKRFTDQVPGCLGRYRIALGPYGISAQAGLSALSDWGDGTYGGELSRYWLPGGTAALTLKVNHLSRIDKDNPLQAALGLRSEATGVSAILAWNSWVLEAGGQGRFFPAVSREDGRKVLGDTDFFAGAPRNRLLSGYLYGYRPAGKYFLLGGFASYADSRSDFYRLIHREPPPSRTPTFMYFPYDTPMEAWAAGGVCSGTLDLEDAAVPLGNWTAKITFPFYSRRKQFYIGLPIPPGPGSPGSPGWEAYATFQGGEPWTGELRWQKALLGKASLGLSYRYSQKPYLEYGFFRAQSYRIHTVAVSLSRP